MLPSSDLAVAVASEWREQDEQIDPASMPLFSLAVTVVDRIIPQQPLIIGELADYGHNDLLCYRAIDTDLAVLQQDYWQPWLEWTANEFEINQVLIEYFKNEKAILPSADLEERFISEQTDCVQVQLYSVTLMVLESMHL